MGLRVRRKSTFLRRWKPLDYVIEYILYLIKGMIQLESMLFLATKGKIQLGSILFLAIKDIIRLELMLFSLSFKAFSVFVRVLYDFLNKQLGNEPNKQEYPKFVSAFNQRLPRFFYFLLDEEYRAHLIDLRVQWLRNRPKNWHINLEIEAKSFIFLVNLHLGFILSRVMSRIKSFNPMPRKPRF